jgi:nucleosome binding factor SPN SPT16 subunit
MLKKISANDFISKLDLDRYDVCYSFILENGLQTDRQASIYTYPIHLQLDVNCDRNEMTYLVENLFTGEKTKFNNYREALGYFKSIIDD